MMTSNIMLDLETLGTHSSPIILRISAVLFDFERELDYRQNYIDILINPQSCSRFGLTCDAGSVNWWLRQDPTLVNQTLVQAFQTGLDLPTALNQFSNWIKQFISSNSRVNIWGNGVISDNVWLQSAYRACNLEFPWSHYLDHRDVRTFVDTCRVVQHLHGDTRDIKRDTPFIGVEHNSVDDCIHQIRYCKEYYKVLTRN